MKRAFGTLALASLGAAAAAALVGACGLDLDGQLDTSPDAAAPLDASHDATLDTTVQPDSADDGALGDDGNVPVDGAHPDAPVDAPTDAPVDAPTDAPTDAPADAPVDAPTDAPADAADGGSCARADGGAGLLCNGTCVDPTTDHDHCGGCSPCAGSAACESGTCVPVAIVLEGFRHEQPCTDGNRPFCGTSKTVTNKSVSLTGTAGKTYALVVRVRGVVEQKTINGATAGGATGTNSGFFVVGGTPAGGVDKWNTYSLAIAAPATKVFFNAGASGHTYSDCVDYLATVQAAANTMVTFTCDPGDALEAPNLDQALRPIVIPGIAPAPQAFDGQFLQLDVQSVRTVP